MAIRKRTWGDGKEAFIVDLVVRGKRVRRQHPTLKEAKAFELDIRNRARAGTFRADGSKMSLEALQPSYFEHLDNRHARGKQMTRCHLLHVKGHLRNYVIGGVEFARARRPIVFKHGIGHHRLTDLDSDVIEEFYDHLMDEGLTVKTVREVRNSLMGFVEFARKQKYIGSNPVREVPIAESRNAKAKRKISPPPKLLVSMMIKQEPAIAKVIMFAALTGVRSGEQRGIRWRKIAFSTGKIKIDTRLDRWSEEDGQGTKTAAGNREIPMADALIKMLEELRRTTRYAGPDDFVFANTRGRPMRHPWMQKAFYRSYLKCMEAWPVDEPKPPRPRWHDLRHFAISCWIEAGLAPKAVQQFAGHASIATTMDVYGHLFPAEDHRIAMGNVAVGVLTDSMQGSQGTSRAQSSLPHPTSSGKR